MQRPLDDLITSRLFSHLNPNARPISSQEPKTSEAPELLILAKEKWVVTLTRTRLRFCGTFCLAISHIISPGSIQALNN